MGLTSAVSVVAGSHGTDAVHYPSSYGSSLYGGRREPSAAEQAAALASTVEYRRQVERATQRFAAATAALARDCAAGDYRAARADELAAQAAYDAVRADLPNALGANAPLDALLADQAPGLAPVGLHAVEADLWSGRIAAAAPLATQIAAQGTLFEVSLFRTIVSPSVICQRTAENLGWLVDSVIASSQEPYSHRDLVDVWAVVDSAREAVGGVRALGRLAAPSDQRSVDQALGRLIVALHGLGSTLSDAQVSAAQWRTVAQSLDGVLAPLGRLSGALYGYGTGRAYA